jgi:uncharacterized membrane protein YeaQ/YmgE (transglycosylase-associated protein family)
LAGLILKSSGFGLIGNIIVGVIGGFIGGWLTRYLGIGGGGLPWLIVVSILGAWILLFLLSLIRR